MEFFFKKTKNNTLSYSPVFPLLVIYPRDTETLTRKDTCTPMFMAALFSTAMIRKQRNHPSADERLKRHTDTHNGIPLSHKNNGNLPFATTCRIWRILYKMK